MDTDIIHNKTKHRFELTIEGHTAFIDYLLDGNIIELPHTWVPKPLEGRGIGAALAKHVLDYAASNKLGVIPSCPFIKVYIDRHPQYQSLVVS
jgi:predicted GNAT family acetyltransferase